MRLPLTRRLGLWLPLSVLPVAVSFAAACGSSKSQSFAGPGSDSGTQTDATAPDDGGDGGSDGPTLGGNFVSIAINPKNPTIKVVNGVIPAAMPFTIVGTRSDGTTGTLSGGTWSYDRFDLGTVDGGGKFTATGFAGGTGTLTASVDGLKATTPVTVDLQMTYDPGHLGGTLGSKFSGATAADPLMALDYPYDKTVFPRGLPGPVAQWCLGNTLPCTGSATDVYHILITGPTASFEAYTTSTPMAPSFTLPTTPIDVWRKLTDSTTGALTFSIARYDGTTAYKPTVLTWTIAAANLAGTIYYWEINNGNVVKMPVGQGPASFLQIPAASPAITCVACHSVSKDGKTVVAAFNGSASPWGTFDTTTGSSLFVYGSDPSNGPAGSGFQAISPDGKLVLYGQERQLAYLSLDAFNSATELAQLNPGAGNPCQPAWSGDGNHVAFAVRTDGNWLDYTQSTLWTADINPTASPPVFSNITQIVAANGTRPTTTYPSYSADSKWISFERSTQVRSRGAQAEIWLTSADGTTQMALDAANTGTGLFTQTGANYEGTFMPVAVGGYFWLVFVSERVYGNILTDTNEGTSGAPGRHKQLWVTAIDGQPTAGKDPSHPAFWLSGQNTADQNMRGEWALDPCKQQGASCQAGYQCCAGYCRADDAGTPVCSMPTGGCSSTGEACKTAADCCSSTATCIGGFCNVPPQ